MPGSREEGIFGATPRRFRPEAAGPGGGIIPPTRYLRAEAVRLCRLMDSTCFVYRFSNQSLALATQRRELFRSSTNCLVTFQPTVIWLLIVLMVAAVSSG